MEEQTDVRISMLTKFGGLTDRQTDKDIYLHKETHISYTDIV